MELELEFGTALCYCKNFRINGIDADEDDFGEKYDANPEDAPDYGCGNMKFFPKLSTKAVLEKYKISVDEYKEISEKLEIGLSFGCCGWCS